jgi:hypothetical protein
MAQEYEVGYRKPPKTTRFKAGKSGKSQRPPQGEHQPGNRSLSRAERADHRARGGPIAGADCGFASFSTSCEVHPSVVWAKLSALTQGARIATEVLWSGD